jgi:glyoxylase-like metal-dependent hydrolase (beta-lactamase superfamily II)
MATEPVLLAPGVWRIPTFGANFINSFAFENPDGSVVLVDAGMKGAPPRLVAALSSIGKSADQVGTILLTHAHPDHQGGAAKMRETTGAAVHVHDDDAEFVRTGKRPPGDPAKPLARVLSFLPGKMPSCEVDDTFADNEVLPLAGGLRVLHTPGHSPGHCSFLHEQSGVLITGDALFNLRDKMAYSLALFCSNFKMSQDTADRLGEVDYEIAAFTHGPEIRAGARDAVRSFLRKRRAGHSPGAGPGDADEDVPVG